MAAQIDAPPPVPVVLGMPQPVTRDSLIAFLMDDETGPMLPPALADQVAAALIRGGYAVEGAPPARSILTDAQTFAERTILAELVVRLFRFYIMGSIVLPDTPLAMDWLKSFIDGVGHGPLGAGPLRWPRMVPSACKLLEKWGFEPTPSDPPYVIKRRGG